MIKSFFKDHGLSLLSLAVALTALFYNTWRNEQSELNRNYRQSGFQIIREAAHLQLLVDRAYYASESTGEDPIMGWTQVNFVLSLSRTLPQSVKTKAENLKSTWSEHWQFIGKQESANKAITEANQQLEASVLSVLTSLD